MGGAAQEKRRPLDQRLFSIVGMTTADDDPADDHRDSPTTKPDPAEQLAQQIADLQRQIDAINRRLPS